MICNDENYPRMMMDVLKHCHILDDHGVKKLLFLYWEVVEKTKPDGSIKDEVTLACNALRQDLMSPNEFIRGRTLRLISKIMIKTVLETVISSVNECLKH
jgi:coatomer subunit beta